MHTADKNAQIVLTLLKQYGIRKIVVSPGTTNVPVVVTIQNDPWFEVYSVVDERSAAYFATGLSFESQEPVVISCTGATASRNYLSGMTEAYYRNLPIIALTSQHHTSDYRNLVPQITDRRVSQNDVKKTSVILPFIKDDEDAEACEILVNEALMKCTSRGGGPVHINLPVDSTYAFAQGPLAEVAHRIHYYDPSTISESSSVLKEELLGKRIGVFIGSHKRFSDRLSKATHSFIESYDTVVYTDHTSSYNGPNKILTGRALDLAGAYIKPDILIDMGSISGDYSVEGLGIDAEVWRISEDGEIHKRFRKSRLTKLFDCPEETFFSVLAGNATATKDYFNLINTQVKGIERPDLPLSGVYVAGMLADNIPKKSSLHLSILNSLRNMNNFVLDETVVVNSNVGGFGIDGPVSTLVGQSMSDSERLYFGLVGDLAFFYDMNSLGIRHIKNNIRILMINNGQGAEFRLNLTLENEHNNAIDDLVAAKGHNGSAKLWAKSMGFEYMSASTKDEFNGLIDKFCTKDVDMFDKPVFFEVFTEVADEQIAFDLIRMQ